MCRYTITVYQCKYTPGTEYDFGGKAFGTEAANDACMSGPDNYLDRVQKNQTTIASTNDKTSITYGYD